MRQGPEIKVTIGIQARSTSTRLPGKVFADLGGKPVLQHMIDTAKEACTYLNKFRAKTGVVTSFYVLCPTGDPIKEAFERRCNVIEGPEDDVLSRYMKLSAETNADYFVRITADCPLLPSYLITKHIKAAIQNDYDYISNVDEALRTQVDGFDVEVISKKLLEYVNENAKEKSDREHVTTFARKHPPKWARVGHVIPFLPLSELKLSIDTEEDLARVRKCYQRTHEAMKIAEKLHGPRCFHRF